MGKYMGLCIWSGVHDRKSAMIAQELSISLWAMAKLGYHPGRILADFGRRIEELLPLFYSQACSNALWGLSVLQVPIHSESLSQAQHKGRMYVDGGLLLFD
jgi:hypothetical protein